jgi:hypothetical protein
MVSDAKIKTVQCPDCDRYLTVRGAMSDEEIVASAERHGWRKSKKDGRYYCWICVMKRRRATEKSKRPA